MVDLADKTCVPCRGGVPPLHGEALRPLQAQLPADWAVVREHHLGKAFTFPDYAQALAFVDRFEHTLVGQGRARRTRCARGSPCFGSRRR